MVAALDSHGVILETNRFPTPVKYDEFVVQLSEAGKRLQQHDFIAGCMGVPGRIDRRHGIGEYFGNLPWQNVPLQNDAEKIFRCPMLIENDANLGGLSESMLLPASKRVLYVTISTGIGTGFIVNHTIDPALADSEGGQMLLEYHGKRVTWEDFASGRAIVRRFGKKAASITDDGTWQRIANDLAAGFTELIAIMQPDVIVIGGSVGNYFDRFEPYLLREIKRYPNPLLQLPVFRKASRPDKAVLYGCYDLARSRYGTRS